MGKPFSPDSFFADTALEADIGWTPISNLQLSAFAGYNFEHLEARLNIENLTGRTGYMMNNAFQPEPPRTVYLTLRYTL